MIVFSHEQSSFWAMRDIYRKKSDMITRRHGNDHRSNLSDEKLKVKTESSISTF